MNMKLRRAVVALLCGMGTLAADAQIAPVPSDGLKLALENYTSLIEHRSGVFIGKDYYTLLKIGDGKSVKEIALDPNGSEVDPQTVRDMYLKQFAEYGKLHPTLFNLLKASDQKTFDVMVWLNVDAPKSVAKPEVIEKGSEERVLKLLAGEYEQTLADFRLRKEAALKETQLSGLVSMDNGANSPFVTVELSREQLSDLAASPLVRMLLAHDPKMQEDLATSLAISNADDVQAAGTTGSGSRVAVWEGRPTSTANLNISASYSAFAGITPSTSNHAQNVSAIINNNTAVAGYAPDSTFFAADSSVIAALDWALDTERVSALNQSFHRNAEIGDGMQADDLYKDYKILHYPWPTIVQAAGNWCPSGSSCFEGGSDVTDEFVNHKGYNSISIGNHNDTASQMSASSCFVNPTSPHSDRELPELSANGTDVTADGITMTGTSQASPAVTGSVALLQQASTTLRIWPEGVRALLFAGSTRNVASHAGQLSGGGNAANAPNNWWQDVSLGNDGFDGAGALNIQESVAIAGNRWAGKPIQQGWDIGTLTSGSFDERGNFLREYQVTTSSRLLFGRPHVKVALAWNSTATVSGAEPEEIYASTLGMDLDLRVYDSTGAQVAYSVSWDNSYEIVDFDAKAGETYTIRVHRWSAKPNAWSWFGIAWDTRWSFRFFPLTASQTLSVLR